MRTEKIFNAHDFYSETMHSVYQLIDDGELLSVNEVDDYLLEEAQFYVKKAPDEVIIETLPDDLRQLNEEFGEITSKKGLAWCSLILWMQNNNMVHDALKHFSKKYN